MITLNKLIRTVIERSEEEDRLEMPRSAAFGRLMNSVLIDITSKEGNVLFNDALNTFYLRLYGRKEMFYLTTHSTHFIYGYMASDIWLRTILIVRKETSCCHIGYSFRLTARVLLYAPSHRQDSTYHGRLLHQSRSTGWNDRHDQC